MKLTEQRASLVSEVHTLREGLHDVRRYLNSPKFYDDTTVQVSDVLLRIREVLNAADDIEIERMTR